ncbi:tetratricopeptide repeat protein [Shewanella sp. 5S214]|uniref:tetratricopeptide repeat protein n=1 Tax=Shewanella sp. 5S214 TaxID=3229999 RepID=UPI00352FE3B5
MQQVSSSNKKTYIAAIVVLLLISLGCYVYLTLTKPAYLQNGTVLVLPVNITSDKIEPLWNRYAAMDMLIHQLNLGVNYPLLQTEDIINIISLISRKHSDKAADIKQIMAISGAVLVIESSIKSTNNQYQLAFTLHQQHSSESDVVNVASIEQALLTAAELINQQVHPQHSKITEQFDSRFSPPQLIHAIALMQGGDSVAAEEQLSALIDTAPDNLVAQRLLAMIQLQRHQYQRLNSTLTAAIVEASRQKDERELARFRLLLAQSYTETNKIEHALSVLSIAKTNAAKVQDWLTLGYISQLAGVINQRIGRNADAREQFKKAIEYHKMMGYPVGQTQALNDLAELEMVEHNYPQAYRYINRSYELVAHRRLDDLETSTLKIMSKIENKMQHR